MTHNLILDVDSYKASHYRQYPPETTAVSSYIESRGGEYADTVCFGLQHYLKRYLCTPISEADIAQAGELLPAHGLPFNEAGWRHILKVHHGYLPLEIEAVPEGTLLPVSNVMLQVRNTDPACAWLTSYVETALLRAIWYPTTVATRSYAVRQTIRQALDRTADSCDGLSLKLQDFGARGASSYETAAIGGAAHLLCFEGTDNLAGIRLLQDSYGADMPGLSIPAAEHSTITAWGEDGEVHAFENMLGAFAKPGAIVAVVSDSYDLWHAIDELWGTRLRRAVEESGATLVVRPDSGDPVAVVCEALERLMARFGHSVNSKGYRMLPDCVRLIQGDGVSPAKIAEILQAVTQRGLSADNLTFGMGGELLQRVDRDSQRFAMKASAICIRDEWRDVFKDPVTDPGKRSKRGRLALVQDDAGWRTERSEVVDPALNRLRPMYRDGELLVDEDLATLRERLYAQDAPRSGAPSEGD